MSILDEISSIEFDCKIIASTPGIMRKMLLGTNEVRQLRILYDSGSLAEEQIRKFVSDLLRAGAQEPRFPFQVALAAIAVAMEARYSSFAEEYIHDLSRIKAASFSMAAGVARECAAARRVRTIHTDKKEFQATIYSDNKFTFDFPDTNGQLYRNDVFSLAC